MPLYGTTGRVSHFHFKFLHCSHAVDVHCSAQPSVIDRVFAELCGSLFYLSLSLLGQLVEYDVHPDCAEAVSQYMAL